MGMDNDQRICMTSTHKADTRRIQFCSSRGAVPFTGLYTLTGDPRLPIGVTVEPYQYSWEILWLQALFSGTSGATYAVSVGPGPTNVGDEVTSITPWLVCDLGTDVGAGGPRTGQSVALVPPHWDGLPITIERGIALYITELGTGDIDDTITIIGRIRRNPSTFTSGVGGSSEDPEW